MFCVCVNLNMSYFTKTCHTLLNPILGTVYNLIHSSSRKSRDMRRREVTYFSFYHANFYYNNFTKNTFLPFATLKQQ